MKIYIFVGLLFAGLSLGLMAADIETSSDVSSVGSSNATGGAVAGAEVKDSVNRTLTNATVGDDASDVDDKDEANVTVSDDKDEVSDDSGAFVSDDRDETNVTSALEKNETHHEASKTDKRHAVYGTYYVNAPQPQQQQLQRFEQETGYEVSHNRGYADTIPGVEGKDYPIFSAVPPTSFSCSGRDLGLYGDVEARCQVWHNCQVDGRKDSFLCPNGTLFNQQVLVCDWWYNVECETTPSYYGVNAQLIQQQQSYAGYQAYPQQISRYQSSSAGNNGYYLNYQKPFYVQTTTFPTGYYFNTGTGASYTANGGSGASYAGNTVNAQGGGVYSAGSGASYAGNTVNAQGGGAYSAGSGASSTQGSGAYSSGSGSYAAGSGGAYGSSAAAGSSFVSSTNNLNSGSGSGYYYRPSYQSTYGSGSSLGGYGYTVSGQAQTPGYVTMRYDIPGGQYASGQLSGSQATGNAGFQYSYSTGQLPGSLAVPTPSNTLQQVSQAHRVRYTQRLQTDANGDRPDHPNYNEKSGYNYRPPQPVVPTATIRAIPAPPPTTQRPVTIQVVQPQITVPIQPFRPIVPIKEPIVHPNANEKSGYNQPRLAVPVAAANVGSQKVTTNYAFNSYNAQVPVVKQTTTYTAASQNAENSGYSSYSAASQNTGSSGYSSYNAGAVQVPVVKQTSTYTAASQSSGNAGSSSYNSGQRNAQTNYQFSTYQGNQSPQYPVIQGSSGAAQFASSGAQSGSSGYSYSNYNRVSEAVHPNANEKSGYVQQKVFVPVPVARPLPLPDIQPKVAPSTSRGSARHSSYSFSTYNVDHPNINEKSGSRISLPVIATTVRSVNRPPIHVVTDPIDHPNYREKSGYNPRPYIGAPLPTPRPTYTRLEPPRVQVDCAGYTNCPTGSNAVKVQYVPERQEVYANFGQRIEAAGVQAGATSGSMAASDRSAAPAQGDNSYY